MTEDCIPHNTSVGKLAELRSVPDAEMHAALLAGIGELAVAWAKAQGAWEEAPRRNQEEVRRLMRAADAAHQELRSACRAFIKDHEEVS